MQLLFKVFCASYSLLSLDFYLKSCVWRSDVNKMVDQHLDAVIPPQKRP